MRLSGLMRSYTPFLCCSSRGARAPSNCFDFRRHTYIQVRPTGWLIIHSGICHPMCSSAGNGQSHLIGVNYLITLPACRFLCCGHSRASTGLSLEKGGASRRASVSRLGEEPPQLATGANERSLPMRIAAVTVEADRRRPKKGRIASADGCPFGFAKSLRTTTRE